MEVGNGGREVGEGEKGGRDGGRDGGRKGGRVVRD